MTAEPPFLAPGVWRIERIANQAVHHIRSLDLKLDPAFLAGINASRRGELRILVEAAGAVLAEQAVEINLLPPSHWGGVNSAPELLAAFVRPTDPSIDVILREASDKLAAAGRDEAMDGYFTPEPDPAQVELQLGLVYASKNIPSRLAFGFRLKSMVRRRFVLTECLLWWLKRTSAARPTRSESGTFETCRGGLTMSVVRGRPEMVFRGCSDRF
ncbi:hypothetical protein [Bradyrhizobium sp. AZCC 2289]|uniref:hypothetical protein n=1 Tax=Bradyrhizobium sp. AZCC 2289 TaxID=3117026 RepID=UPI002FF35CEE